MARPVYSVTATPPRSHSMAATPAIYRLEAYPDATPAEVISGSGALTLSGTATAVRRRFAAGAGSLALTGTASAVRRRFASGTGTLSLTGTASGSVAGSEYVVAVLADSPLAYWRLNDTAPSGAGSLIDSSGNGNHATPNGGIAWDQPGALRDDSGAAALFGGTNGYVDGGSTLAASLLGDGTWTVELWFFAAVDSSNTLFSAGDGTRTVRINHSSNQVFSTSTAGGNRSSGTLMQNSAKNWHHLVLTSAGEMWVNGVAKSGTSSTATSTNAGLYIGARNNVSTYFNGRIAEVAIYDTVLTEARVLAHFAAACDVAVNSGLTFESALAGLIPSTFPAGTDNVGQTSSGTFVNDSDGDWFEAGTGTFRTITYDNPTPYDVWASAEQGTYEIQFKFTGTLGTWMLGQLTGKDRSGANDTNDAIKFHVTATGLRLDYAPAGGGTVSLSHTATLVADTIYTARFSWDAAATNKLSITLDGGAPSVSTDALPSMTWQAIHHLLIGNDLNVTPTTFRLRNVKVYGSSLS